MTPAPRARTFQSSTSSRTTSRPERIRHAQMVGALATIRDAVMLDGRGRLERLRESWPELAERIESAVVLVD